MINSMNLLVSGSSELPKAYVPIAVEIGRQVIVKSTFMLVTGGLLSKGHGRRSAADWIVVEAALKADSVSYDIPESRIITILPDLDVDHFERFRIGKVVKIASSNLRARRYSMVLSSNAVIALNGAKATKEIIDLAFMAGKPVIPVPATGGSASEKWTEYEKDLVRRLCASSIEIEALNDPKNPVRIATTCLNLLRRVLRPRCFIAMPYTGHPIASAFNTISKVVEKQGYQAVRVDQENFSGDIVQAIWRAIENSDLVIADITGHKPNVYYELGIAHAMSKPTLIVLYEKGGRASESLPFDICVQRVMIYSGNESLKKHISAHLPCVLQTHVSGRIAP